jgi:2-polyprenyl-6-methoxyphenol hydroxylase-like FAD-dependent oxidoreductase
MSAAIALRRRGDDVLLIDLDPEWRVYGAGITITGPTLRAFGQLGVLDDVLRQGFAADGLVVRSVSGDVISSIPTPVRAAGEIPGTGGIMRPVLHQILADRVRALGAGVRLGVTVDDLRQDDAGVDVRFSDDREGRFDLVVGADGIFSSVRSLILADPPTPQYTGQACWRLKVPRHPEIDRRCFFLGGPVKVGLTPVSADEMYMFVLEASPRRRPDPAIQHEELRRLLAGYGGPVGEIRDGLSRASQIVYRPLEAFLLPPPWHVGRVVLVGDAAHPTTPQLASGAGLAVEDALVLEQELDRALDVPQALERYMARRWARCRLVVENSLEIGRREQAGLPVTAQTELVERSLAQLADPI